MSDTRKEKTILIVDDTPENIDVLSGVLRPLYRVKAALSGTKALTLAQSTTPPDMILLDVMMPELDGYEVIRQLKQSPKTKGIPVIFVTAKSEAEDESLGLELGAVDYITKPISPPIVKARIETHLALYDQNKQLEQKVQQRTKELNETREQIIRRLGRAAEFKDNETGLHVIRMSFYSELLAKALGLPNDWCKLLKEAAPMHDVGKIGIPDRVLLKPGKLDDEEWLIMKRHPEYGAMIIGDHDSELLKLAKSIALTHHEKWDGNGYPNGLAGEAIPIEGRIVAIADVFDALTTERPYKKAWSIEKAVALIEENKGTHFDPTMVPVFLDILPEILSIRDQYAETNDSTEI